MPHFVDEYTEAYSVFYSFIQQIFVEYVLGLMLSSGNVAISKTDKNSYMRSLNFSGERQNSNDKCILH